MKRNLVLFAVMISSASVIGCRESTAPPVAEFEPNFVLAYHMGEYSEQSMDQALDQTTVALTDLFGTPDEPKLPEILAEEGLADLVSLDHLNASAGPEGLYRVHKCASCHGVTGNGRGETAALLNPYPRDYRLGRFKFKSTPIGTKPTKEDLAYLIEHGIGGTQMVKIPELKGEDIDALVDYVIYLTMRGEVERSLLMEAGELDFTDPEEPDSLYLPNLKDSEDPDQAELFADQWELLQDFALEAAESWAEASEDVFEVPARDTALVPDEMNVLIAASSDTQDVVKQSIARGKELFLGEKASCAKCHGKEGKGDGQTNDYDDWAKEWTKKFGVDPANTEEHIPLIARGALPVRQVAPRNFQEGVFRGGDTPEKLYQRIALGIEGTPMPAAAITPEQIWDVVNYVRSLCEPPAEETAEDSPTDEVVVN